MKILGIDHVAVCVGDMDAALPLWTELLGLKLGPREFVATQKTEAAFVMTPAEGDACIELIMPKGGNVGLEKFLEQKDGRAGMHHIAFVVDDLAAALKELDGRGIPLIDKAPRPGARGHQVGFLHPKAFGGVLVELVERGRHS